MKKKNLEAQLELNKTKLRLEEMRLKSQAQEHLVDYELQMHGITEEFEGLGCIELGTSSTASPIFVPETVPQTQQNESTNAEPNKPIPVSVSNVASSFPNQSPSTRTAHPADAFACPDSSEMVTMPTRRMPHFEGDPLHFYEFTLVCDNYVAKYVQDSRSQLMALIECCVGESKKIIKACAAIMPPEEGLHKAKFLLWRQNG